MVQGTGFREAGNQGSGRQGFRGQGVRTQGDGIGWLGISFDPLDVGVDFLAQDLVFADKCFD